MKRFAFIRHALLVALLLPWLVLPSATVQATLLIMPIHLILTDRDRTGNITLLNTSGEEAVFRVEWRYQRQLETGAYEMRETPFDPERDLSKFAVFSPRQVTLLPGQKQRVRISLRRPPDLADGEYRAHLALFRMGDESPSARPTPENNEETATGAAETPQTSPAEGEAKMQIGLKMNVSYSLPVVLRQGTYNTSATIESARLLPPAEKGPAQPRLNVVLNRTGDYSVFGKISVFWTPPGQSEKRIGIANNVNILPEITRRTIDIMLNEKTISGGTLRVVYEGEAKEKGAVLDEKTFPVGG